MSLFKTLKFYTLSTYEADSVYKERSFLLQNILVETVSYPKSQ